jgi:hypothetical protein
MAFMLTGVDESCRVRIANYNDITLLRPDNARKFSKVTQALSILILLLPLASISIPDEVQHDVHEPQSQSPCRLKPFH